jgi:outer membrane receptor protein involved in Fe transport
MDSRSWTSCRVRLSCAVAARAVRCPATFGEAHPRVPGPQALSRDRPRAGLQPVVDHLFGGNPALRPETSRQATLGLLLEPIEGGLIELDL